MSPKRRRHRTRDTEHVARHEEEVGLGVGSAAQRYAAYKAEAQAASSLRARWVSTLSFTPDPFQIQALDAVEAGSSVLVAAPTGAGKTIVGQFGAYVALEQGMRAFYTTPIKALSNQKYLELCDLYGSDNVGLATGDTSVNSGAPVVVMTTEVLRNMIYAGAPLDDLGVVILDEVHYLADKMRGPVWEEVIIHLPAHVAIIALSATVSNAEEFGAWIREVRSTCEIIVSEKRPVPLYQHMIVGEDIFDLYAPTGKGKLNPELVAATGYPLLGEEGHSVSSFAGRVWVLDPIDGTMNYVTTHRDYAISLALCEDGRPVLGVVVDVVAGLTYTAIAGQGAYCDGQPLARVNETRGRREVVIITDIKEIVALPRLTRCLVESRGHRRYGSAALECVEVAASRAGAFVHMWVSPWDIAAAYLICVESGVTFTRLDGTPLDVRYPGSVLVGWPQAHTELLSALMRQVE